VFSRRTSWDLAPNAFSLALERARNSGRELLDLTVSNPTEAGIQYDERTIREALSSPAVLNYEPAAKGLLAARNAVADYYSARNTNIDPEHIVLTVSTSEAYSYVFRLLCDPDDEVLVAQPSYPLFEFLADIQDVKLRPFELIYDHGWQIDFHSLEQAITPRTRAILLVHPNNPTGSYIKEQERERLNQICRTHELALVVDEVFLDYSHDASERFSFASNSGVLTFALSGLSKISGLPQMKSAWIVTSGPQTDEALSRIEVIADTYLSPNAPVQSALPVLLQQRHGVQKQLNARIAANLRELDMQLAAHYVCSRLDVEGGWYATLRVPITRSDEELAIALLEQISVVAHPGHFFNFPRDGYLVLSLITPERGFREGLDRVLRFFR
jgi:alanine-synthesizing transaminase